MTIKTAQAEPPEEGFWELIWSDEFNQGRLDTNYWTPITGLRYNKGIQNIWEPNNVKVNQDGHLVISFEQPEEKLYTTGAVETQGKFAMKYGYIEARIKIQEVNGKRGAFWLTAYPGVYSEKDAGHDGAEIDILETMRDTDYNAMTIHWDGYKEANRKIHKTAPAPNIQDGKFHTFGLAWDEGSYKFYYDNQLVWTYRGEGVSQVEEFIRFTGEIGKGVVGDVRDSQIPDSLLVDWVRVYKRKDKPIENQRYTIFHKDSKQVIAASPMHQAPTLAPNELNYQNAWLFTEYGDDFYTIQSALDQSFLSIRDTDHQLVLSQDSLIKEAYLWKGFHKGYGFFIFKNRGFGKILNYNPENNELVAGEIPGVPNARWKPNPTDQDLHYEAEVWFTRENGGSFQRNFYTDNPAISNGEYQAYFATHPEDYITYEIYIKEPGLYRLQMNHVSTQRRGIVQLYIDSIPLGEPMNAYSPVDTVLSFDLGYIHFDTKAYRSFTLKVLGKDENSSNYYIGLDNLVLEKINALDIEAIRTYEGEDLKTSNTSGSPNLVYQDSLASQGAYRTYFATQIGEFVEFSVPLDEVGMYQVKALWLKAPSRASAQLEVNGIRLGPLIEGYDTLANYQEFYLGTVHLTEPGSQSFKFIAQSKNDSSSNYYISIDKLTLEKISASPLIFLPDDTTKQVRSFDSSQYILIYPNPTHHRVQIVSHGLSHDNYKLELLNKAGETQMKASLQTLTNKEIDLSPYPSGMYYLRLIGPNQVITRKIWKY